MPIPGITATPVGVSPITPLVNAQGGRTYISWIGADGSETVLTDDISDGTAGVVVQTGIKGFDSPPFVLNFDDLPSLDGSAFRSVRAPMREILIPVFVWAPTRGQFVNLRRAFINKFNPKNGVGTLKVVETDDDGSQSARYIDCYYLSGLDGDTKTPAELTYGTYGIILRAPDPWWYGAMQTKNFNISGATPLNFYTGKAVGSVGEHTGNFLDAKPPPIIPWNLSPTLMANGVAQTVSILGDTDTWPVWTVTGKGGAQLTMTNLTTGKSLQLNYDFTAAGDVVTIDTRPGVKTAVNNAGTNVWQYFGPNPKLWEFKAGDNLVSISYTLSGGSVSTSTTGTLSMQYKPRYAGA